MTLELVVKVITMKTTLHFDRVPDSTLDEAERDGGAYSNEIRSMARELKELRAKLVSQAPTEGPTWLAPVYLQP